MTRKHDSKPALLAGLLMALAMLISATPAMAQGLSFQDEFELLEGSDADPLTVSAWYKVKEGTRTGNLYVEAVVGEGYHTYSQNHGGVETKTSFEVPLSDQFQIVGTFQPDHAPHAYEKDGSDYEEFEEVVVWSAPFILKEGVDPDNLLINVNYRGQVCDAVSCQPPIRESLDAAFDGYDSAMIVRAPEEGFDATELARVQEGPKSQIRIAETPEELAVIAALYKADENIIYERLDGSTGVGNFWTALIGAFLGGMLLNLMPCVFPVLGLKVMGFVEQAGSEPRKIRMHGIAFSLGLIVSMWVLAGTILAIKASSGESVNWGQQMGNRFFVGGIVLLLFVLGLNLAGLFEMGLFMTRIDSGGKSKKGYSGSFASGVLTTLVATPCSGPFLGAAMGYTLAQPALIAMLLFTVFGLGIAFPYLVMAFFPALINMLPRPGAWMETFKKLMAFTLFAAAAFFAKTFGTLVGMDGFGLFLLAVCVIALGLYFYGKYSPAYIKGNKRMIWGFIAPVVIAGAGLYMAYSSAKYEAPELATLVDEEGWVGWVPGRVEQHLAENRPVWVDYTANW